jgi:tetratricopeptide (TPR) repeat protein
MPFLSSPFKAVSSRHLDGALSRAPAVLLYALLALAGLSGPVAADDKIPVRVGEHPDFNRLVFDGRGKISYTLRREGDQIILTFGAPVQFDVPTRQMQNLSRLGRWTQEQSGGQTILKFQVAAGASVRDFMNDGSIVIDIKGGGDIKDQGGVAPAVAPVKPVSSSPSVKSEPPKPTAEKMAPVSPAKKESSSPADGASKAAATDAAAPQMPALPVPAVSSADLAPAGNVAPTAAPAPSKILPPTTPLPSSVPVLPPDILQALDQQASVPVLAILPGETAGLAAFVRGGYVYLIFDQKIDKRFDDLVAKDPQPRLALEIYPLTGGTAYRFAVPLDTEAHLAKDGNRWVISLTRPRHSVPVTLTPQPEPDFPLGARLRLAGIKANTVIRFNDPVVGDQLFVVPVLQPGQAVSEAFSYVDAAFVPALQGVVVRPLGDALTVRQMDNGVEVTQAGGLHLSAAADTGLTPVVDAKAGPLGIFNLRAWAGIGDFNRLRQKLQRAVVDAPAPERDKARLDLARFYFANGRAQETLGILQVLSDRQPDLLAQPEFLALRGAARVMTADLKNGQADLKNPAFDGEPEITLWKAWASAQERDWQSAARDFALADQVLATYPDPYFIRFHLLAIESAMATGDTRRANLLLDRLAKEKGVDAMNSPAGYYLRGVVAADANNFDRAENFWKLAAASNDRLFRIRAELALVDLDVGRGTIKPATAAERLERLRFAWRGDDLEQEVLHRLGMFYLDAGNFVQCLRTLDRAVALYPDSFGAAAVRQDMVKTLFDLFIGPRAASVSAVDAYTIYDQFNGLLPEGPDKQAATRGLAEKLVSIDLLERAAGLLEGLLPQITDDAEKAALGARIAGIRLLDQKPQIALQALDSTTAAGMTASTLKERRLLRARALSDLGRTDEALALLDGEADQAALRLRVDITWRARQWDAAAMALSALIGAPPPAGQMLSEEKTKLLLNAATARALNGDEAGLHQLAKDFGHSVGVGALGDAFRLLTRADDVGGRIDMAAVQARAAEVDLFQSFLDAYRSKRTGP